jgi:hypothetical protein
MFGLFALDDYGRADHPVGRGNIEQQGCWYLLT